MASTVPASEAVPVTLENEDVLGLTNTMYCAPDWNARLPPTVIEVPGTPIVPGENVPAELMVIAALTVPVPASVLPLLTATALALLTPFSTTVPELMLACAMPENPNGAA